MSPSRQYPTTPQWFRNILYISLSNESEVIFAGRTWTRATATATEVERKANRTATKRRAANVDRPFHLSCMGASSWSHISRLMVITIYHPEVVEVHACGDSEYAYMCNTHPVEHGRQTGRVTRITLFTGHTGDRSHLSCCVRGINLERTSSTATQIVASSNNYCAPKYPRARGFNCLSGLRLGREITKAWLRWARWWKMT